MTTATAPARVTNDDNTDDLDDGPRYVRLTVNLALDVADAFKTLTRRRGITATEGVRRAIAMWKLIEDESAAGGTVQIVSKTGRTKELVLF